MQIQRKTALIVGVLVVLAIAAWALTRPAKPKLAAPTAIPVRVVSVAQQDIPRFVSGIGTVLSLHSVVIRPQVDGILTRLLVKEGQQVKRGEVIAAVGQTGKDIKQPKLHFQIRKAGQAIDPLKLLPPR